MAQPTPLRQAARFLHSAPLWPAVLLLVAGCLRQPQSAEAAVIKAPTEGKDPKVVPTSRPSGVFVLRGRPFCFVGTNNYYLTYKSRKMADDVFVQAAAMGIKVIRTWGFIDRGSIDGTVSSTDGDGTKDGVYFQYWDPEAGRPAYNEGEDGLPRLDYVLDQASKHGLKILVVLTNSWKDMGGMDQYLSWYGLKYHHQFYTDERVRQAYKDWAYYLVNRTNTINGRKYRDDPTIFAWELANEPRCKNATPFSSNEGWDNTTITTWADEMSAYVKSLDPNHIVAVGDEGFFASGKPHWAYGRDRGNEGVDHEALLALEHVDFGTFHLYPDHWGAGYRWGHEWIEDHIQVAQELGKPTLLEEYGIVAGANDPRSSERRHRAYTLWNDTVMLRGGNASMFWMLAGYDEVDGQYPDYDNFTIYNGTPDAELLGKYAARFQSDSRACQLAADLELPPDAADSPFVSTAPPPATPEPQAAIPAFSPTRG